MSLHVIPMCTRVCGPVCPLVYSHACACCQRLCPSFMGVLVLLTHLNCVSNLPDHEQTRSLPDDSNTWLELESSAQGVQEDKTCGLWKQNSVLATCCRSQSQGQELNLKTTFAENWQYAKTVGLYSRALSVMSSLVADSLGMGTKALNH